SDLKVRKYISLALLKPRKPRTDERRSNHSPLRLHPPLKLSKSIASIFYSLLRNALAFPSVRTYFRRQLRRIIVVL
ncbi:unnamed protein product, partial [Brassica oleracea var. botrytis]